MYHIDESNVDDHWELMAPGLERALGKTLLGKTWDMPSAYQYIKDGKLLGFYQPESGYSGLYSINSTPLCKILYWFWSGKLRGNKTPVDVPEVTEYLVTAAKVLQCKYINGEGRAGFKHFAESQGYQPDSNIWFKEVII